MGITARHQNSSSTFSTLINSPNKLHFPTTIWEILIGYHGNPQMSWYLAPSMLFSPARSHRGAVCESSAHRSPPQACPCLFSLRCPHCLLSCSFPRMAPRSRCPVRPRTIKNRARRFMAVFGPARHDVPAGSLASRPGIFVIVPPSVRSVSTGPSRARSAHEVQLVRPPTMFDRGKKEKKEKRFNAKRFCLFSS